MLFKPAIVAAVLLGQTLASPLSLTIEIEIDEHGVRQYEAPVYHAPVTYKEKVHSQQSVSIQNISVSEIEEDIQALESQAKTTGEFANSTSKGDLNAIKKVVNSIGLQALGYLNLVNSLPDSDHLNMSETAKINDAYWNMTAAVLDELKLISKNEAKLCALSALADFEQNLASLASTFEDASRALEKLVPSCPPEDPRSPACNFRGDLETAIYVVPIDIQDVSDALMGVSSDSPKNCPYDSDTSVESKWIAEELK